MFEIFCIGKLDVFSSKDAGLRLAMEKVAWLNLIVIGLIMINLQKNGHHLERLPHYIFGKQLIKII